MFLCLRLQRCIFNNMHQKIKFEINEFIIKVHKWNKIKKDINHIELTQIILEDSNYINYLEQEEKNSKNPENLSRVENIRRIY